MEIFIILLAGAIVLFVASHFIDPVLALGEDWERTGRRGPSDSALLLMRQDEAAREGGASIKQCLDFSQREFIA
ncbi:MAG TPA: hypothetical protein VIM12_19400 [Noviherbaspirillum sp.]|uniref:hypothetical protein n=1 Tax=Noviherbaspirillum sp. TaxID=1926288 RepID=UPI002F94705B